MRYFSDKRNLAPESSVKLGITKNKIMKTSFTVKAFSTQADFKKKKVADIEKNSTKAKALEYVEILRDTNEFYCATITSGKTVETIIF